MQLDIKNSANRKLVYQSIKEKYEKWLGTPVYLRKSITISGFCYMLKYNGIQTLYDFNSWNNILIYFPEVNIFNSYANPGRRFWFPQDDNGFWKRVSILSHAIRMCDYPWTIPFYKLLIRFKLIRLGL